MVHKQHSRAVTPPISSLSATIGTLNVFGQPVNFTQKITGYAGERLYCKAMLNEATLLVFIDDVGPNSHSVPMSGTVNKAQVTITYEGASTETATASGFSYGGGLLHLTASLNSAQNLTLTLTENADTAEVPASFVVILDDNNTLQLRWIDEPVELKAAPTSARVIPPTPKPGAGVSGPFGIETP